MEILSTDKTKKKNFKYTGKGIEFAVIFFKNIFLSIISLGLYYPWAKTEKLKYHYQSTELDGSRFSFNGTGKEVFKGFIKLYATFGILYAILLYGLITKKTLFTFIFLGCFYLAFLLLIPFAIHGSARYKSSRSSWKGIYFKYLGDRMEFFWKFVTGFLLTVCTLGIYGAWFSVEIRKYIFSHLRFGNLSFDFKGTGETLFWINLKYILLFIPTLGIYSFWYYKNILNFYAKNTEVTQNGKKTKFNLTAQAGDVFELMIINALLILVTFGLGFPWVKVRTMQFIFRFLEIEEGLNTNAIQQVSYDNYNDAAGENFLDFLDIDVV